MISDASITTVGSVIVAAIAIIPATLAAVWSNKTRKTSSETLHEVKTNGGVSGPNPTNKDILVDVAEKVSRIEERFNDHLVESQMMNRALAELYLTVKPNINIDRFVEALKDK